MMNKEVAKSVHMAVDHMAWGALTAVVNGMIADLHKKLEQVRGEDAAEASGGIYSLRQFLKTPEDAKAILGQKNG